MGYATIANTLGEGRYRIKLDTGEARRVALLAAANVALAQVGAKLNDAQAQVALADEQEAEARASIAALIDVIAVSGDETAVGLATRVLEILQPQYAKQVAQNQVVRQQYATLKDTQADLLRQRAQWEALQTITYREAWCADYTTSTSTQYVATIDIPGDSNLVLLAPRCRAWRGGDGTISSARKAAALSQRATQLISAGKQLAAIEASLTTARAEEAVLIQQTNDAQAAYVATPTDANYAAFAAAAAELSEKRHEIANLTLSKQVVTTTITRLNQEIAFWSARAASETPDYGDGVMLSRELTSPAQAFFNAAIFPGWQKWMPTYRWGIASDVDDDANVMTVTLGQVTSSAQSLGVDQEPVLYRVPITYLTCNSNAFFDGDRVIVQFEKQIQSSPRVIGFLDNPKQCLLHNYVITGYDGTIAQYLNKKVGYRIPEHVAPAPDKLIPFPTSYYGEVGVGIFRGWFKTVGVGADPLNPVTTSYTLPSFTALSVDPLSGVGVTAYTAMYYFFPQYITGQYWNLEYLSHNNRTDWVLDGSFQQDPSVPTTLQQNWSYYVRGTVTCRQPIRLYFGDSLSGSHLFVGDGFITSLSHTEIIWTSDEDDSIYQGPTQWWIPGGGPIVPGTQLHPEEWDPPWYADFAPRPDLSEYAPILTIDTIYGGAIYALDEATSPATARWKIQGMTL